MEISFVVSSIIFLITFIIILTERMHRTVIALAGAVTMVLVGITLDFYSPGAALAVIDFNTILLLFGMMVIVSIIEETGFFQYMGIIAAQKTGGNPWALLVALGSLTTVFSLILDNVTTIILMVPVTIIITRIVKISPVPILMAEAILSNVGGVATLVGDPPNIMIGSAANFTFNDFLIHSLPVVFVAWFVTLIVFKLTFRKDLSKKPQNIEHLKSLNAKHAIKDKPTLIKILVVLGLVVILFFTHNLLHLSPAMVAVIGASLALLWVAPKKDPQKVLEKVELSVLLFFVSLFVLVGGLEHAGVLEHIANIIFAGVEEHLLLTALIVLWSSAILSAIVDNIPLTVAMIPMIAHFADKGIEVNLLWWALVFGVGFGGNGSPIGSTANIIVVSKSEHTDTPITFNMWLKSGLTTMVASLSVASVILIIFTEFFIT